MNGIGDLLAECTEAFPLTFEEYQKDKIAAKERLRIPMVKLANKLKEDGRLRAFLNKSLFNGGEVNYLTVKQGGLFHVFLNEDVVQILADNLEVCNSRAISVGNMPEQKVLLRYKGLNVGEIEMRNDSKQHYREIRFNMLKPRVVQLLLEKIPATGKYNEKVLIYGKAVRRFGRWPTVQPSA